MASTPSVKLHRARVTYGKSSRKKAQTGDVVVNDFPSSPSGPSMRQNTTDAREGELSNAFPKYPNPQPTQENRPGRGDIGKEKAIRQRSSTRLPISFESSRSKTELREAGRAGYTSVYDVPSSGDERNGALGNQHKRRRTGAARNESRSRAPDSSHRPQQSDLAKAMAKETSIRDKPSASNMHSDAPVSTGVQVVIKQNQQARNGRHSGLTATTPKKALEEGSHQEKNAPSPTFGGYRQFPAALAQRTKTSPPDCAPAGTQECSGTPPHRPSPPHLNSTSPTGGFTGQKRRHLGSIKRPVASGQKRTAVELAEQVASRTVGDSPPAATPSRRRLVDGLNACESNANGNRFASARIDSRKSSLPSQSDSEDSACFSESSTSRGLASSMIPGSDTKQGDKAHLPASSQTPQAIGPKITYSRQRSFLSEASVLADMEQPKRSDPLVVPQPYGIKSRGGYASTQAKVIPPLIEDESSTTGSGAVRSIHELRQAGGNARFQGMVDSIFDDFEDDTNPISRKRSGLIQLCCKLMDYQFTRQFLENGLDKRLSNCFPNPVDIILSSLVTCAYALLLSTGPTSNTTLHSCCPTMLKIAPLLLEEEEDVRVLAKSRRMGSSRAEQAALRDLCKQMSESKIWSDTPPLQLSPQIMTLRSLEMAVRKVRERGECIDIISSTILDQLVKILLRHSSKLQDSRALPDDLLPLELVFSTLESYTVEMSNLDLVQESSIKELSQLGPLLSFLTRKDNMQSRQLQILDIRLILNVTNNNPTLCEDFATPELIGALVGIILSKFELMSEEFIGEKREAVLDIVILALGTLINLTEWSETSRKLVLRSQDSSTTFIDNLLQLFTDGLGATSEADSVMQTHANVAFGYLSVLLSTLCLNDEARLHLRQSFPERNLNRLLATVDEFLHYYRKVEEELHDPNSQDGPMAGFTSRLQGIINRIREFETAR